MGFEEIILYQLGCRLKSLSVSIAEYLTDTGTSVKNYTKQAYSKARMKIRYEGYIELNDIMQKEYYAERPKDYKGYRLLGIDGSEIELPHEEAIGRHFGKSNNNEKRINIGWSTILYDLQNKQVVDAVLNPYGKSERRYAIDQLRSMKERGGQLKDIIVADRGFPSLELFIELNKMGYDYVIRYNGGQFLRETVNLQQSNENDIIIEISVNRGNKRSQNPAIKELLRNGCKEAITLRALKIELENGTKEYIITSILERDKFRIEDFNEIYKMRWNQELYYDFQKNVIQIEDFSGKTVESILQDYHSRILVGNIHSMIVEEADKKIDEEVKGNPKLKHREYKANRAVTFGIMKNRIYKMLDEDNNGWDTDYDELVQLAVRYRIPTVKNRAYPRKRKGNLKYPLNKKRVI